jgi:hypothetical protein
MKEEVVLSNSFYKVSISLITRPDKDTTKKKLHANSLINIHAIIYYHVDLSSTLKLFNDLSMKNQ